MIQGILVALVLSVSLMSGIAWGEEKVSHVLRLNSTTLLQALAKVAKAKSGLILGFVRSNFIVIDSPRRGLQTLSASRGHV